jgi:hypothetical protein
MNQRSPSASTAEFFNKIGTSRTSSNVRFCAAIGGQADIKYALAEFPDLWVHDLTIIGREHDQISEADSGISVDGGASPTAIHKVVRDRAS